MTTRSIEECLDIERLEEEYYSHWLRILVPKDSKAIVFDPYIIKARDLMNMKPGKVCLVRVRRPGWGRANIKDSIMVID